MAPHPSTSTSKPMLGGTEVSDDEEEHRSGGAGSRRPELGATAARSGGDAEAAEEVGTEAWALAVSGEAGAGGDARSGTRRAAAAAAAAAMTGEVGEWTGGGELSGAGRGQGH